MLFGKTRFVAGLAMAVALNTQAAAAPPVFKSAEKPNILVIVTDDMAYSDIGAFGGEIDTPNLDALAKGGARFTNFQVSPTCSPTRSMILTGNDNHHAGVGNMAELLTPEQRGQPGYEGRLNDRVATIAERLRDGGYHTILSGKWHLGQGAGQWPADRGFDRSYVLLPGGDNHFGATTVFHKGAKYAEDHQLIQRPLGAYSTDYFTDNLLKLLDENKDAAKPFFAYLAYTAPHWPLQAPKEVIAKYKGKYDAGYEALREQRIARQKALGLLGDVPAHPIVGAKHWADLTPDERALESRKMEIYAAMIDRIDVNIGRVVDWLKANGKYDNTIVIFLSDNGAAGSAYDRVGTFDKDFGKLIADNFDNSLDNLGQANSMVWYGPGWGQAGTAPLFLFKIFSGQGGLRAPLIVNGPGVKPGLVNGSLTHVTDIAATALDLAGLPTDGKGLGPTGRLPVEGLSWKPLLEGKVKVVRGPNVAVGGELFGGRNLTKGDYKALWLNDMATNIDPSLPAGRWLLFNIRKDPGETTDLAASEPAKLAELVKDWDAYAKAKGVIVPKAGAPVGQIDPTHRNATGGLEK
ncbi:arylsulfatase [Sphingobium wenxiniae]|uniref:Arylsulfatase n=1 Tax=Sphingobium wenxiniae (strain DSM 21828 / CGMCC 1.7748 / JZ-1) TaxID=595605 RepID=A0A562K3R4_SPHWJ|nr:arylsulfatase [Sphingobium wenxiniae]MBB6193413.1 arylsulfatase [Sphingobium wenxiniae]TWH90068.1 arylsulfatase [Sphingobium wenxiniae]